MERLKLSTRKSLHREIEIDIEHPDGKEHTYTAARFTEKFRLAILFLEKQVKKNVKGAASKWSAAMFGIPKEILDELPESETQEIYMYWMNSMLEIQNERIEKMMGDTGDQIDTVKKTVKKVAKTAKEIEAESKNVQRSGKKK